jgi:2-polyprenyl-3-methyl-5-hydroxy-6-metoxy-1,4-benzoquinol methylase
MDAEEIFREEREHYNSVDIPDVAEIIDFKEGGFWSEVYLEFERELGDLQGKRVLDVCCGKGESSFALAKKGACVVGIDLSSKHIQHCKKISKKLGLNVHFEVMNAQYPEFKEKFDLIVGFRAIHHLPDLKTAFSNYNKLLNSGGRCIFIEPMEYNPIVNFNRKVLNPNARTKYEHPLMREDIKHFMGTFKNGQAKYYEFLSSLAFVFKLLIKNEYAFKISDLVLKSTDRIVLALFPYLKIYCWQVILIGEKI